MAHARSRRFPFYSFLIDSDHRRLKWRCLSYSRTVYITLIKRIVNLVAHLNHVESIVQYIFWHHWLSFMITLIEITSEDSNKNDHGSKYYRFRIQLDGPNVRFRPDSYTILNSAAEVQLRNVPIQVSILLKFIFLYFDIFQMCLLRTERAYFIRSIAISCSIIRLKSNLWNYMSDIIWFIIWRNYPRSGYFCSNYPLFTGLILLKAGIFFWNLAWLAIVRV